MHVRREQPHDRVGVRAVETAAFGRAEEADLVDALRADPAAWVDLSFVALEGDRTVGHLLLTRLPLDGPEGGDALALAPMAVAPEAQGTGVGTALARAALAEARQAGERLVVVLGHPGYYPRFGFAPARPLGVEPPIEVADEAWMALDLTGTGEHPRGRARYPAAFGI